LQPSSTAGIVKRDLVQFFCPSAARLKDWCGIAMRYTRCGDLFLSSIALAAAVILWLQ
jgi:hypothetical protein